MPGVMVLAAVISSGASLPCSWLAGCGIGQLLLHYWLAGMASVLVVLLWRLRPRPRV